MDKDTLYGETKYGQQEVATGSMVYKHHRLDLSQAYKFFEKPEINLKVIPSVTGTHHTTRTTRHDTTHFF